MKQPRVDEHLYCTQFGRLALLAQLALGDVTHGVDEEVLHEARPRNVLDVKVARQLAARQQRADERWRQAGGRQAVDRRLALEVGEVGIGPVARRIAELAPRNARVRIW
jgi:hypothetical protein